MDLVFCHHLLPQNQEPLHASVLTRIEEYCPDGWTVRWGKSYFYGMVNIIVERDEA